MEKAERPLSITEVAACVGRSRGTIENWIHVGVWIGGVNVRLAARRVGGRYAITAEALAEFEGRCNPEPVATPPKPETPAQRDRRAESAMRAALAGGVP